MTELEDIKELGQETVAANRELVRALSQEELIHKISVTRGALRDSLLDAVSSALVFYKVVNFNARRLPIEVSVPMWAEAKRLLTIMVEQWRQIEKTNESDIDGIVEHFAKVFVDLVAKADQEYRSHVETAYLLDSPANAQRLAEAIADAEAGRAKEMTLEELRSSGRST
jgi:hypothetical protein